MARLAAAQLLGRGGSVADARAAVAEAGADLVVLPEAYLPGYNHARGRAEVPAFPGLVAVGHLDGEGCALTLAGRTYRKRFLSPAEARVWKAGTSPVVVETAIGRVGLAICSDVLQPQTWADFAGKVDVVAIAAAWPDYRGRSPIFSGFGRWRDRLLRLGARALGVPVVFANAYGPWRGDERFSGGSGIWDADGTCIARAGDAREVIVAEATARGSPRRLEFPARWRAFAAVYRGVAMATER